MKGLVKRKSLDSHNKRQHILDAAYTVFSQKGYHRATVDEIITLADTGKGTVYNYFVNKERLFYTLIQERSAPFHCHLEAIAVDTMQPINKVYALTREFLKFYSENAGLWRVLLHEMRAFGEVGSTTFNESQQEKYKENFEKTLGILESVIKEGTRDGVLQECNARQAAYGLFSAIIAIVFQNLVGDDAEATAKNIANTFLFGIAVR